MVGGVSLEKVLEFQTAGRFIWRLRLCGSSIVFALVSIPTILFGVLFTLLDVFARLLGAPLESTRATASKATVALP